MRPRQVATLVIAGTMALGIGIGETRRAVRRFTAPPPGPEAAPLAHAGSGVIVSELGHILTHESVVSGARRIVVVISNQDRRRRVEARLVVSDPAGGLALLEADATSKWVMRWRPGPAPGEATACGWPLVALTGERRHLREMSACTGSIGESEVGFPLGPGYDGGLLADMDGRGVGVIGAAFARSGVLARPPIVRSEDVLRFLASQGIMPPDEKPSKRVSEAIRLARLQFSVVQVETDPPRPVEAGMPRLLRSERIEADDIVGLSFEPDPERTNRVALMADCWRAPGRSYRLAVETYAHRHGSAVRGSMRYRRDALGNVAEIGPNGGILRDLAAINGLTGFHARAPLLLSADGRAMLVGDARVHTATGTVLWRLDVSPADAVALSPNGDLIAHASPRRPGTVSVWRLPDVDGR